jgi:hypothetical protein
MSRLMIAPPTTGPIMMPAPPIIHAGPLSWSGVASRAEQIVAVAAVAELLRQAAGRVYDYLVGNTATSFVQEGLRSETITPEQADERLRFRDTVGAMSDERFLALVDDITSGRNRLGVPLQWQLNIIIAEAQRRADARAARDARAIAPPPPPSSPPANQAQPTPLAPVPAQGSNAGWRQSLQVEQPAGPWPHTVPQVIFRDPPPIHDGSINMRPFPPQPRLP